MNVANRIVRRAAKRGTLPSQERYAACGAVAERPFRLSVPPTPDLSANVGPSKQRLRGESTTMVQVLDCLSTQATFPTKKAPVARRYATGAIPVTFMAISEMQISE